MAPVKETSGFTVGLIVSYVRDEAGDDGVRELIAGSGIGATERQLADARRWWSYADKVALFEAAEAVVGDPEVATRIGRTVLAASVAPAMVPLLRAFGGPSPLLRNVAKAASRFSTAATMEALEIGRTNATLTYRLLPPHTPNRHDCGYTVGLLSQAPPLFGLPEATVDHPSCQVLGADRCTYHVTWLRDVRSRSRRERRREALALESTIAIEAAQQREDTVAALLRVAHALADVTTSAETAQRLADGAGDVIGCDRAIVLLWDEDTSRYRTAGHMGIPEHLAVAAAELRVDPTNFGGIDRPLPDEPIHLARRQTEGALADHLDRFEAHHVAVVPLRSRGQRLGLLLVDWASRLPPGLPGSRLDELLDGLADQGAAALENARLLETVRRQASHDALTGLPNQVLFAELVRLELGKARRLRGALAVGVLDLDRFKAVNDHLGHASGDALLIEVATRLRATIREVDTVARMGGDEFTFLLPGSGSAMADQVATRILTAFEEPFLVEGRALRVSPSIGFALHPSHGDELGELLRRADSAMYKAKASGRNTWVVHRSERTEPCPDRLTLESELARAVAGEELVVAYQPVVRVGDRRVVGVEALVRWHHPSLGLLMPDDFVPLAEEVGLIEDMDAWVLHRACMDLGRARPRAGRPWHVAVNAAGRSLTHPAFSRRVAEAIADGGIRPDQLVLEVTENVTVEEAGDVVGALSELRTQGVRVAIDDFGRGQSALARLDQLPMDQLKVDKAFLHGIASAEDEAPVVSAIIAMAIGLGLEVLAEGVERPEQHGFLVRQRCHLAQGYLFGRPAVRPIDEALGSEALVG